MSQPITWRGITRTASMDGAAQSMLNAQNSFQNAIAAAQKGVQNYEAGEEAIRGRLMKAQEQAYLDTLQGAGSVEQLEQLRTSGKLDPMLAALDADSRARVRGAVDSRQAALREQTIAGQAYAHNQLVEQQKPTFTRISALLADPSPQSQAAAKQLLDDPAMANLLGREKLVAQHAQNAEAAVKRTRADAQWAHTSAIQNLQLTAEQQKAKDEQERRNAEALTTRAIREYQDERSTYSSLFSGLAREFNGLKLKGADGEVLSVGFNRDGGVNWEGIGKATRARMDEWLKARGDGKVEDYLPRDTAATKNLVDFLRRENVSEARIAALMPTISSGMSTAPAAAIGRDAYAVQYNEATNDLLSQEARARSPQMYSAAQRDSLLKELLPEADAAGRARGGFFTVDKWKGEAWKQAIKEVLDVGIVVRGKDGKPEKDSSGNVIRMLPSADAIRNVMANIDGEVIGVGRKSGDIKQKLKEYLEHPDTLQAARDSYYWNTEQGLRNLSRLESGVKPLPAERKK